MEKVFETCHTSQRCQSQGSLCLCIAVGNKFHCVTLLRHSVKKVFLFVCFFLAYISFLYQVLATRSYSIQSLGIKHSYTKWPLLMLLSLPRMLTLSLFTNLMNSYSGLRSQVNSIICIRFSHIFRKSSFSQNVLKFVLY